ncbi:uncharacterized protein LOC127248141 [Andrographis paniculata]|uniref:uncharacterized protein LOC127248141 n=1 Tax=Andrographis paniculata TaxID=175694 RepID=UPI0021E8FEA2|nr:uncharacterized protein LOC127248141 [Andrographis paniculata]
MGLENTIAWDKNSPSQDRAKTMIFLCHHIDEALKMQYVTLESALELWERLKERYDHLRLTLLPRARREWQSLRLQDFKSVQEYNSAMFKITSRLRHCGENVSESDMMKKTFSTFHGSNIVLQQQYRERDANAIQPANPVHGRGQVRNQRIDRDRNQNRGRGRANAYSHNNYQNRTRYVPNRRYNDRRPYRPQQRFNTGRNRNNGEECTRFGIKGHWTHVCRTASHLTELYRASKERQGRIAPETNHTAHDDTFDDVMNENITHLDADDMLDIADDVK